jgi:N-acetylglutamate synthase-like GNAT family acetyltransferase
MRMQHAAASARNEELAGLSFRQAADNDMPAIFKALLRERMNPLSLKAEHFVVAARESDGSVQGFGQLAPLGGGPDAGPQWLELRSLIVDPDHRQRGIGRRLLAELVRRADDAEIYLTTLASTTRFYAAEGFQTLQRGDVPRSLLFEYAAGTVVARIAAGQQLAVMRRRPGGTS